MKTKRVDVPEEVLSLLKESKLGQRPLADQVKAALAIHLFQEGIISVGKAAEIAGEPRATFELMLGEMGIPAVRYRWRTTGRMGRRLSGRVRSGREGRSRCGRRFAGSRGSQHPVASISSGSSTLSGGTSTTCPSRQITRGTPSCRCRWTTRRWAATIAWSIAVPSRMMLPMSRRGRRFMQSPRSACGSLTRPADPRPPARALPFHARSRPPVELGPHSTWDRNQYRSEAPRNTSPQVR